MIQVYSDVAIIGGSFAGLSAALQLSRGRRRATLFDTGMTRNHFAAAAHGFPGQTALQCPYCYGFENADLPTTVPGVFAAGDITRPMYGSVFAAADGVRAAVACHQTLVWGPGFLDGQ